MARVGGFKGNSIVRDAKWIPGLNNKGITRASLFIVNVQRLLIQCDRNRHLEGYYQLDLILNNQGFKRGEVPGGRGGGRLR